MLLHHSAWPEVEAYLVQSQGIILPIGSTEQHGPNGLIGTDAICAEAVAIGVGEAAGALVAPTIAVGMAVHHMDFPGSMTLRPSTLVRVVVDNVLSLARHGFTRFFFVNGHGGNIATLNAAFYEIYAERPDAGLRCRVSSWWEAKGVATLAGELFADAEGSHATPSEVSVTQHLLPHAIKTAALSPAVAPAGGFFDAHDFRRRYPDGRIGSNPGLATPEHGARLLAQAVAGTTEAYRHFLGEG